MKKIRIIILVVAVMACLSSCRKNCNCETTYFTSESMGGLNQSSLTTALRTVHIGQNDKCSDLNYRNVDSLENGYRVESRTCEED